jgi:hypothetical protein
MTVVVTMIKIDLISRLAQTVKRRNMPIFQTWEPLKKPLYTRALRERL